MFDISFAELTLVFIIALVVLGPERLPKAARTVGHWMGRARAAFSHLKNELDREVVNKEMQDLFRQKADALRQETEKLNQSLNENLADERKTETGSAPQPPAGPPATPALPETDLTRPQDKS
ncbi:Sec-independent protein translocase TatB [Alcanivorax sp. S71-1-4]|uniref:Sec-independent protein translocase protein TatB n=1 Tax=Alcanivorax sp. S71-1-4 TaxID=1177159 RepID=UPI00135A3B08|nr:Sec-independent protein translocase protein TatB [Alcanivorax sp. S71-1-4]KAF0808194.1 Sec-independent protein translocase TatB [Alcanivorax sp. S71-1-4]